MDSNIENSLDLFSRSHKIKKVLGHSVLLSLGYPVALRELLLPTGAVAERCQRRDQPAARLCREEGTAARLPPLPAAAGAEHMDLSPVKWEGNHIRKKKSVTRCKKRKEKSNGPATGVA